MPDNDELLQRAAVDAMDERLEDFLHANGKRLRLPDEIPGTVMLAFGEFARAEIALDRKRVYDEVEQTINSFIEKLRAGTSDGGEN